MSNNENELVNGDYATLKALFQTMETYYTVYENPEYDYLNIPNATENYSSYERIEALEKAIKGVEEKEGLDFSKARGNYEEALNAGKFESFSDYFVEMGTTMDENQRMSALGARTLEIVDLHKEESELIRNDPEYALKMYNYYNKNNRVGDVADWAYDRFDNLDPAEFKTWNIHENGGVESLDENSITARKHSMGSDLVGLNKDIRFGIKKSKESQEESKKEENTQLQTTDNNSILRTIKNKISKIMESLKNLFKGNKGFESDIINPAENILEESTNENSLNEKDISSGFKEYITDKINSAKENMQNLPFEIETNGKDLSSIMRDGLGIDKDKFDPIPNTGLEEDIETEKLGNLSEGR